ncbi:MAG: hypothetical protein JNN32_01990 [Flavobacteriales bacterium]|nr:hypothetical protein [Flavobacteriales bacterium]
MSPTARFTLVILVLSTLAACQPDEDEVVAPLPPPAPQNLEVTAFSNLAIGNYWIYQRYRVDSADNVASVLTVDSIFISGDSVVNGETYWKVHRNVMTPNWTYLWRDSAGYVVTEDHEVVFCADPMDQLIYTEVEGPVGVQLDYTVYSTPETITVEAGTFSAYRMQAEITSIGGFPELADWRSPRSYWAEDVGRVRYYEFFAFDPLGIRYDLVRYDVSN